MMQAETARERTGNRAGVIGRAVVALVLLGACAAPAARAEEAPGAPPPAAPAVSGEVPAASGAVPAPRAARAPSFNNDYALLLGIQYWDKVDDFDPAIPPGTTGRAGRVEPAGLGLEGSYHRRVARWPGWELFAGGNLGVFYHPNKDEFQVTILPSGRRIDGELLTRGLYLMPSVKLFTGEPAPWRYSLGAGAGYVLVDFSTQLDDGMTVDTYFREETLGGYLSAGADRLLGGGSMSILLRLEAKVLFADFGSLGDFAPGAGSLTGPVFLFQAGIAVAD